MNYKALFLSLLFLTSQFIAFGGKAEIDKADYSLNGLVKKSDQEQGCYAKSNFTFEVEEESELEFLKKNFPYLSDFGSNSKFGFALLGSIIQRYFTHCVSGFRHVRRCILLRSIRI